MRLEKRFINEIYQPWKIIRIRKTELSFVGFDL